MGKIPHLLINVTVFELIFFLFYSLDKIKHNTQKTQTEKNGKEQEHN